MVKKHNLSDFVDPFDVANVSKALDRAHIFRDFSSGPLVFYVDSFQAFESSLNLTQMNEDLVGIKRYIFNGIQIIAKHISLVDNSPSNYSERLTFSSSGFSVREYVSNVFGSQRPEVWNNDSRSIINAAINQIFTTCQNNDMSV